MHGQVDEFEEFKPDSSPIGIEKIREILQLHFIPIVLGVFGIILIGVGFVYSSTTSSDEVEILGSTDNSSMIVVEIAGAVRDAGVYEFTPDARVNDALEKAGGITDEADTYWIDRFLNKADFLEDGQKLYIPSTTDQTGRTSANVSGVDQSSTSGVLSDYSKIVNINTASTGELESLWGIGQVTAQKIIEGRPYSDTKELLEKKIIKSNVFEKNKDHLSVY